jgi:NTE family protein
MVDSSPLRRFLEVSFGGQDLPGIQANLDSGRLKAVALIALRYATGQTVSFTAGREFSNWERPLRRSVRTDLKVDHVLASAALPLFFAPVEVDGEWYGDGGVRLTAPLAPAVHLGADRILAISTRFRPSETEARKPRFKGRPRAAQVLGNLMSATFLDVLDQDAMHLERINRLVSGLPPGGRHELRPIKCLVIRPSRDIASLANEFEPKLPGTFRFLTRRWGTRRARSQELLSTILFQGDYIRRLMEVGEEDGANNADAVADLLSD